MIRTNELLTKALPLCLQRSSLIFFVLLLGSPLTAAPWLTFTEVCYRHPAGDEMEFIEIYNLEAPHVDLSGWKLEGEVDFEFPKGTQIEPRQCLVIAKNLEAFKKIYPKTKAIGPFEGRLNNDGGRITLLNNVGAKMAEMRYGRDGSWSAIADGTGHTLVLADALFDARQPLSWKPSEQQNGSPGTFEQSFEQIPGDLIIKRGEEWKYFPGTQAPPEDWKSLEFDDSKWESGKSGFGFGDNDDETVLRDMPGRYLSLFTRKVFSVENPKALGDLSLLVDYDDGFVAFLNGKELARANVESLAFDQPARGSREAGRPTAIKMGEAQSILRKGKNVLAVAGFNAFIGSSDFSLIVELESKKKKVASLQTISLPIRLNEISTQATSNGFSLEWIELYNPSSKNIKLSEVHLSDDPERLTKWKANKNKSIPPRGFAVLTGDELNLDSQKVNPETIYLSVNDGKQILDALSLRSLPKSSNLDPKKKASLSIGRYPDGTDRTWLLAKATHKSSNQISTNNLLHINEIHYHPSSGNPDDEFIELYNQSSDEISLEGLRLRGGVSFDFPKSSSIKPKGYLVIARNPSALSSKYKIPAQHVIGPFKGGLSNRGEEIRLEDIFGRTLDFVSYADRHPWPTSADGWGSSLELIDSQIDNSFSGAWDSSKETSKSEWTQVKYTAGVYLFGRTSASLFQFMLLNSGECLIDDLKVIDKDGKTVIDENFNGEKSKWRGYGTHRDSKVLQKSPYSDSPCYHLVAKGRGNSRTNFVSLPLNEPLEELEKYTVSFKAKWISGSPLLLSRTSGQGLARSTRLTTPILPGTPGKSNSITKASPPVIGTPVQSPIIPQIDQAVTFTVPITARSSITTAELRYRHESMSEWKKVALKKRDDLHFTGVIPPLAKGRVEFTIHAADKDKRKGVFPNGGQQKPTQYAVGLTVEPSLPAFTVLVSDREWEAAQSRQRMSNYLMDATLVYGDSRIFYNVGFRARGSGFTRGSRNWRLVFGADTLDGRAQLTFDGQGRDYAKMNERLTFWLLDQVDVPTPRQRYIHFNIYGQDRETGIYEDVEKINGEYLSRWFPGEKKENQLVDLLYKVDDYWDFRPSSGSSGGGFRGGFGGFGRGNGSYVEAYMQYETSDPEDYRWNFPPRANGNREEFGPLVELIRFVDSKKTKDEEFQKRLDSMIDVDQWARILAGRTLANDWDTYGMQRGKNAYLYRAPSGLWYLLPWDSDLSWAGRGGFNPFGRQASLISGKFPAVNRIFDQAKYRRHLLSNLAFLASKKLDPNYFSKVIADLEKQVGVRAQHMLQTAASNRTRILDQIPKVELQVTRAQQVKREDSSEILRIYGTAPLITQGLQLDWKTGKVHFLDEKNWVAEFEFPQQKAKVKLQALDREGDAVAEIELQLGEKTASESTKQNWDQWPGNKGTWKGFTQYRFEVDGRKAYVVLPKQANENRPWIWRMRFPGFHAEMDVSLLGKGFHVAYIDMAGMLGSPTSLKHMDKFYTFLTTEHGLSKKVVLEGVSRGGLFAYNWAVKNTKKIACIYCDTPVCDFKSWPGGRGSGLGSKGTWNQCLKVYGLTEEQALAYKKNPIDHAPVLAKAQIPILHIISLNDKVVPPEENTLVLKKRLQQHGWDMEIIEVKEGTKKSHGHHFTHPEPEKVVQFILKHAIAQ